MPKLENAILTLNRAGSPSAGEVAPRASLVVTAAFLVAVLSIPLYAPQRLIWLAVFPVVAAEMAGIGFGNVFVKSLWVIPMVVLIGIFNPILDRETAFVVGGVAVSRGWVSFVSIIIRGLLSMQALLILMRTGGVYGICDALRKIKCPQVLVTQILFTYRYLLVVLEEARGMDMAIKARGFGKSSLPLKLWGRIVGQLLVRSYDRAIRVHRAMLARGFTGVMPIAESSGRTAAASWVYMIAWLAVIAALRFVDISSFFHF